MPVGIYENPVWQNVPDQTMHPGGLTITEQALSFCNVPPGALVLDVGCGAGATISYITSKLGFNGLGLDVSAELLSRAYNNNSNSGFAQARSEQLPIANASVNLILSECTLSIFETDDALYEFERILKNDGYLIISDLYARNENGIAALRELPSESCISSSMTRSQIENKLKQNKFRIEVWQDCSDKLNEFSVCTLTTASAIDPFDLHIAAAKAKLGYYFLIAKKV